MRKAVQMAVRVKTIAAISEGFPFASCLICCSNQDSNLNPLMLIVTALVLNLLIMIF